MRKPLVVLCLLGLPLAAVAQTQPTPETAPAPSQAPANVESMLMEFQQIQHELHGIRQKALEKPELAKAATDLQQQLEQKIVKEDPANKQKLDRFNTLSAQFEELNAAGKSAEAQALVPELKQLAETLLTAQKSALESKEMAGKVKSFDGKVTAEMHQIEPNTAQLLKRADELEVQLRAAMEAAQPSAGEGG